MIRFARRLLNLAAGVLLALLLTLSLGPRLIPGFQTAVVLSGSMQPTIPVGAVAVLRPLGADRANVGDIITFARPGRDRILVTHRVVRVEVRDGKRTLFTKGDANAVEDPWEVPATRPGWRCAFAVPYAGYLFAGLDGWVRLALFATGVVVLIGWLLLEIWRAPARTRSGLCGHA